MSYKDDNGSQYKTVQQHQSVSSSPALPVPSPPVLWVVGGPGSNKYSRVREAVKSHPRWTVLHTGEGSTPGWHSLRVVLFFMWWQCYYNNATTLTFWCLIQFSFSLQLKLNPNKAGFYSLCNWCQPPTHPQQTFIPLPGNKVSWFLACNLLLT